MAAPGRRRGDLGFAAGTQARGDRRPVRSGRRDDHPAGAALGGHAAAAHELGGGRAFTLGGSLFAIGAWVAQVGSGDATTAASLYFAGGLSFNAGGYASLLSAINAPRGVEPDGTLTADRWRWWSYEPDRVDWLSTFVLFVGTLAFGISLLDSFLDGLTTQGENRLIWAPELIGCILS